MITIREATVNDAEGKGYVHYQSWIETYTNLMPQEYLDSLSLERSIETARKYPQNTLVAEDNNRIIGFACYLPCRDEDIKKAGEVMAIYILKEYKGMNIGKKLMDECYKKMKEFNIFVIWVLASNKHAIDFYKHLGYKEDGKTKDIKVSPTVSLHEIRMVKGIKL